MWGDMSLDLFFRFFCNLFFVFCLILLLEFDLILSKHIFSEIMLMMQVSALFKVVIFYYVFASD